MPKFGTTDWQINVELSRKHCMTSTFANIYGLHLMQKTMDVYNTLMYIHHKSMMLSAFYWHQMVIYLFFILPLVNLLISVLHTMVCKHFSGTPWSCDAGRHLVLTTLPLHMRVVTRILTTQANRGSASADAVTSSHRKACPDWADSIDRADAWVQRRPG